MTCLEQQLDELELLQSVFSQPGEYTADGATVEHSTAWVRRLTADLEPPIGRLSCALHLKVDAVSGELDSSGGDPASSPEGTAAEQCAADISMTLPHGYPASERPVVYVSSDYLSRRGQDDLNSDLADFVATLPEGEVCLLTIAEWIRDNTSSYCPPPVTKLQSDMVAGGGAGTSASGGGGGPFCRMWLYMHHIYSKTKRRNILDLADRLELSGFCLPGKPGVVCVEGSEQSTKQFYNILRRWNWKSISCRHREEVASNCTGDSSSSQRKIVGFRELALETHGPRQNHMDMGQFRAYLEEHKLGYMFTIIFGVEGPTT